MTRLCFRSGSIQERKRQRDATGKPILNAAERVDFLIETLDKSKTKIIIPTPALAELLVLAGPAGPEYLEKIQDKACFRICDFDQRAAIEVAEQLRAILYHGKKRKPSGTTWNKLKFDQQIVAIAKVEGVETIYSDDKDVAKFAEAQGIETQSINDLPRPPMKQQPIPGI